MFHFPQILRGRNYCVQNSPKPWYARLTFNLIVVVFRREQEGKDEEEEEKKRRGKKSLGLLCIGISLVFSCISFLKAIFPGGCYLHTRQPDVGHYKKDRCRLKYKVIVGEFYIFFEKKKIRGILIQVRPFSITRRLESVTSPA